MSLRRTGFTLIELMMVMAMIAIMLAIAVPSFATFISNYRATAAINEVLQAINLARSEALKRGRSVTLAPVSNDWRLGWNVFVDANNNQTYDSTEELIFKHASLPSTISVIGAGSATTPFNGLNYVIFDGQGYPRTAVGGLITASGNGIVLTDSTGSSSNLRTLCMAVMGRPRIVKGPPADPCTSG